MAVYVGSKQNPGGVIEAGEHVKANFLATRHQAVSKEVKVFLGAAARFAKASRVAEAADKKEDAAREALSEADAARDAALRQLDRKLIDAGEPKANSFKGYGFSAPSRIAGLSFAEETKVVARLVKAVSGRKSQGSGVKLAATALSKSNDAVIAAEARVLAAASVASKARAARDALDRPTRAALSVLKLQVKVAEKLGLTGAYAELFATEAKPKKPAATPAVPN